MQSEPEPIYLLRYVDIGPDDPFTALVNPDVYPNVEQGTVLLDEYCRANGVVFLGWHPTFTRIGVFRRD